MLFLSLKFYKRESRDLLKYVSKEEYILLEYGGGTGSGIEARSPSR